MTSSDPTATRRELLWGAAIVAAGAALPVGPARAIPRRRTRPDCVILVDWDGFGSDLLGRVPMPNLRALTERGSLSAAESTYSTYSNSARASMSTGAYPEIHGNAGYYLDRVSDVVVGQNRELRAETINQALARAGRSTASVGWYMVENAGTTYGDPAQLYVQPGIAPQYEGRPGASFATRVDVALDILHRRAVDSGGSQVTVPAVPAFLTGASLVDVAPTIATLLRAAPPAAAQGRALRALLDPA
jgi:hypothetical protein